MTDNKYKNGVTLRVIERIIEMRTNGLTIQNIADSFGIGCTTVFRHLERSNAITNKRSNDIACIDGSNYKKGLHNFLFIENGNDWVRSNNKKAMEELGAR